MGSSSGVLAESVILALRSYLVGTETPLVKLSRILEPQITFAEEITFLVSHRMPRDEELFEIGT